MKFGRHKYERTGFASLVALTICVSVGCTAKRIESMLNDVPGVIDVPFFHSYEGKTEADLELAGGGTLSLHSLSKESFRDVDAIFVSRVGDWTVSCWYSGQEGIRSTGHNIVELVSQLASTEETVPAIRNIEQLVTNYGFVVRQVERLPDKGAEGQRIAFQHRQPVEWFCAKVAIDQ